MIILKALISLAIAGAGIAVLMHVVEQEGRKEDQETRGSLPDFGDYELSQKQFVAGNWRKVVYMDASNLCNYTQGACSDRLSSDI